MSYLDPIRITITAPHNTGRTTLASLVKLFLQENGYERVTLLDTPALAPELKEEFELRFKRNRQRQIIIEVKTLGVTTVPSSDSPQAHQQRDTKLFPK